MATQTILAPRQHVCKQVPGQEAITSLHKHSGQVEQGQVSIRAMGTSIFPTGGKRYIYKYFNIIAKKKGIKCFSIDN